MFSISSIIVFFIFSNSYVTCFNFHTNCRWNFGYSRLNSLSKDDKGYIVKDRNWFQGLSKDAGASITDPRAVPHEANEFASKITKGEKVKTIDDAIDVIDKSFNYFEVPFKCGETNNPANVNVKSAKIFSFAILTKMDKEATLRLFGSIVDELTPNGTDHANIRNFMKYGWDGIEFRSGYCV